MPCVLKPGLTAPAGTSRSSPVSGTTPLAASCPAAIFITRFQSRKSIHEQRHGPQIRLSGHPDCRGRTVDVAAAPQTTDAGIAGDRKRVVSGKSVSIRVDLGGQPTFQKKKHKEQEHNQ